MALTGVGERLRTARTARGLSLGDIEAATRIKQQYLDALEREAWDELPGAAYARAFLGAYAKQLGLPPDEIVGLYPSPGTPAGLGPRPVEVRITPAAPPSPLRRILTVIAVVFIAGTIVLAYVLVGQLRQFAATRPRPATTTTSPAGAPGGPGTPPRAAPGTAVGQGTAGNIVVTAQAIDRSWVRVVSDGAVVFEGFMSAGDQQSWQGHQVSVRVGNASALDLVVNGQPVGRLGNPGDVVERTFTAGAPLAPGAPAAPRVPAAPPAAVPVAPTAPTPTAPPAPVTRPAAPPVVTPTDPPTNRRP